jgi:signal transduction histidine kinase
MLCDGWDDFTTADRLQMLGVLRRNARGALTQAEDVLAELKSEADAGGEPVEIDLRDALALNAGDVVSISAQHVIDLDGDDGVRCWADPGALQQVVGHLLENAVKYSPTGGTITLGVRQEGRWAVIDVRDEGIGIPSSDDIFEPFKRGHDIPETIRGSGLGLYVVRSLVDRMQGTVTAARNGDGRGSTFTVRLPAALEDDQS